MEIYIVVRGFRKFGWFQFSGAHNLAAFVSESAAKKYVEGSSSHYTTDICFEIYKLIVGDEAGENWGFKKVFVASQNRERNEEGYWAYLWGRGSDLDAPIVVEERTVFFSPDSPRCFRCAGSGWWSGYWMPEVTAPTAEEARSLLESWRDEEKEKRKTPKHEP